MTKRRAFALSAMAGSLLPVHPVHASHLRGAGVTYTENADFDEGRALNVVHDTPGQLELDDTSEPFPFIWVAVSSKGTAVKIDTRTGAVKGEYLTAPAGRSTNPSRTTVDKNGNAWLTNRDENSTLPASGLLRAGSSGSAIHIGLAENSQCQDRNGNGVIDTSTGFGDVRTWPNTGGADNAGGVSTAADECILHYVRTNSTGARHVSVTRDNDVWMSGTGERAFDLLDGETGEIIRAETGINCGGYGGLIDPSGVIWSTTSGSLLRWDTTKTLTTGNATCYTQYSSYGLGIDPMGNVWATSLSNNIVRKFAPDGALLGTFPHGAYWAQGVVADRDGDVWVAHSLYGPAHVGHLRNDGTFVGNVAVGGYPTGVAVDPAGKVWSTNWTAGTATRIDPALAGGIGLADLETRDLGGDLYNYSDMTGSVLPGVPTFGTWTVVHDGGAAGFVWDYITWKADVFGDGELRVTAVSSDSPLSFGPAEPVTSGGLLGVADGRYLKVTVSFVRATSGESPVLHDLTIGRKQSSIEAHPAILDYDFPDSPAVNGELSATLTDALSGAPLPARTIVFSATDTVTGTRAEVCTATTDAMGTAACSDTDHLLSAIGGAGYEAAFAGDESHTGSVDEGLLGRATVEFP